jgi:ribosome-binding protein aMBF1 (putative translation factor)
MGHYCRICGRERPNEQFSGKGHRIHVCKGCNAKPKSERQAIEDTDSILAFMQQSHISEKNVARLKKLTESENSQVASLAAVVLKVAEVKPYKTRRLKFLAKMHPEIMRDLEKTGLICAYTRKWDGSEIFAEDAADSLSSFTARSVR